MTTTLKGSAHAAAKNLSAYTRRPLTDEEIRYMQGDQQPVTSSVLISNSKYLNDPYYRDTFAQHCLRRLGHDLSPAYLVPAFMKAVSDVSDPVEVEEIIREEKSRNPEFSTFLETRPDQDFRLDNTAGHNEGTLGAAIHAFLREGFKPGFMYADDTLSDVAFIAKRQVAMHDIGHLVTGFGTDFVGEVALGMCILTTNVNYFGPRMASYVNHAGTWGQVGSIMHATLHYPAVTATLFEGIRQGIAAGQAIRRPFFMTDWNQYLAWRLDDLAAELGIVRGPGKEWAWTAEAARG